jgi:hypothetical protein
MIKVFFFLSITLLMNLISINQDTGLVEQKEPEEQSSKLLSNYPIGNEDGIRGLIERSAPNKTSIIKVKQSEIFQRGLLILLMALAVGQGIQKVLILSLK